MRAEKVPLDQCSNQETGPRKKEEVDLGRKCLMVACVNLLVEALFSQKDGASYAKINPYGGFTKLETRA